jgi:hypothetical protein
MLLFFTQSIPKRLCVKNGKQSIKETHVHPTFYVHAQKNGSNKRYMSMKILQYWLLFFCNTWLFIFLPFHCSGYYYFFNKSNICMWTWKCLITTDVYSCSAFILHLVQFSHYSTLVTGAQVTAVNMRKWTEKVTDCGCICVLATVMPVTVTILCLQYSL